MLHSPFISKKHWSFLKYIPGTLFEYFMETKYSIEEQDYYSLSNREELLNALNSNEAFFDFWAIIQDQHPPKKDYFSSLINEEEPYNPDWIRCEYDAYQKRKAFEALSEEETKTLQKEFEELLPSAYQAALEGEVRILYHVMEDTVPLFLQSKRLNCDITDVKPISPVIPWEPNHDKESILARLPDELFRKVFPLLETVDIFNMTLVCKRWKRLINDNAMELKRAEHSATTHMIRFTDWMNSTKALKCQTLSYQHQMFSWCLTRWYCGVAENLEILILDHAVSYIKLVDLLHSCPNLKHLRVGCDSNMTIDSSDVICSRVKLMKLETFMCSPGFLYHNSNRSARKLTCDILVSSPSLRVFKGALNSGDLIAVSTRNPVNNVFNKLVALDLENFTSTTLESLAQISDLELKYLRLGFHVCKSSMNCSTNEKKLRIAFHQLLPKLNKLEMLRMSEYIGVSNTTIRLMTDLKLNINLAVFYHAYFSPQYGGELNAPRELDPFQPEDLEDFRNMLLLKNPDIDLSEIQFVLKNQETLEALDAMNFGFTFLISYAYDFAIDKVYELYDPKIKQRLGIDF